VCVTFAKFPDTLDTET